MGRIACLVLGAGRSERFGACPKLEAMLGGKRVGDYAPDILSQVDFVDYVFVGRAGGFRPLGEGFRIVETANPAAGMGHSLGTGLAALEPTVCDGVLIALSDMPLVERSHITALLDAYADHPEGVASLGESASPPAILPFSKLIELADSGEDFGARTLIKRAVPVPAPRESLLDIDSPDDLALAAAILGKRASVHER